MNNSPYRVTNNKICTHYSVLIVFCMTFLLLIIEYIKIYRNFLKNEKLGTL